MSKLPEPTTTLAPCAACSNKTHHEILHEHRQDWDEESGLWSITTHRLIRCAGCHSISMEETFCFSEDTEPDGTPIPKVTYFPIRPVRSRPGWVDQLPDDLIGLLDEVYSAREVGLIRLTAMGVRTVVDFIMRAEIGDQGTFEQKLERLVEDGLIGTQQKETLAVVVDAGSAAGHRGFNPAVALIDAMLDAIESILHQRYIVGPMLQTLKTTIPPRPPRPPGVKGSSSAATTPSTSTAVPPPPGKD